jgi:hypothetical protein
MPQFDIRRVAQSIAEKAVPCRYHRPSETWRFSVSPEKPARRERHSTPIPSLAPEVLSRRLAKSR